MTCVVLTVVSSTTTVLHILASPREVDASDGYANAEVALVLGAGPDSYMKTGSKLVLGCMVEQAFLAASSIEHRSGLAAVTGVGVSLALNKSILMPLKPFLYPRAAMRAAITQRLG